MGVEFDPAAGTVRLGPGYFETLLDIYRDGRARETDPRLVAVLRDAGVLGPDGPHPALARTVRVLLAERARLRTQLAGPQGRLESSCWMLGEDAAWWDGDSGDGGTLSALAVDQVPARLARLVGLGPRPAWTPTQYAASVHTRRHVVDAILGGTPANRQEGADMLAHRAPEPLAALAADLRSGEWRAWHAETVWYPPHPEPGGPHAGGRGVVVVDTSHGMLTVEPEGAGLVFLPASPTQVWRRVLRLLPPAAEIAP
ncbi:hypothetical protein GA0111570_10460 [Raineyella antarctica]|uniref:EspG family protein n=1 Tax=Raineyella antarctica TaxID=1577474 RepID=A0A1G6GLI1_9ACTN|nr:hypothetical protein [Raineyella antarctica]SDB82882.1 hypothetical protein GA0111570_10460 [Raineyella antarctica]